MGNISSRMLRYYFSIVFVYGSRYEYRQKAERSPYKRSSTEYKQTPKTIWTINVTTTQPRDLTASFLKRGRSSHSSRNLTVATKGNSPVTPTEAVLDNCQEESANKVKPKKQVAERVDAITIARKHLEQVRNLSQKYYKIVNLISNPDFLEKCYEEIKSKPGNMTKGINSQTLDGINRK